MKVELVPVLSLRHIEGFSPKRVEWLRSKILKEGIWTKPLALDKDEGLVLDGQHRMEVAISLDLTVVPAVKYDDAEVDVWSLRPKYSFDWKKVVENSLLGDIYPFKTVKHRFPVPLPECAFKQGAAIPRTVSRCATKAGAPVPVPPQHPTDD